MAARKTVKRRRAAGGPPTDSTVSWTVKPGKYGGLKVTKTTRQTWDTDTAAGGKQLGEQLMLVLP